MHPRSRFLSLLTRQRTPNLLGDFARHLHRRVFLLLLAGFRFMFTSRFRHIFGNLVPHILKLSHDDRSSQTADRSDDQRCKRMPLPVSTSHMSSRTTLMRASAFPDVRKSFAGWMAEFLMMIANRATHPSGE